MYEDDKKYEHESYGAISVNRVSGQTHLFGSDAIHNNYIRIDISEADMRRSLSDDHLMANRRLVTVDLTFDQWARFVSSFGIGMGTPCTLRRVGTKQYADPPEPEHFSSKFRDDLKKTMATATEKLDGLIGTLKEALLPGNKTLGKKELTQVLSDIQQALMQVKSNIPFVEDQFDEHMERKVSAALVEVEGTIAHGLREAGLASLRDAMPNYDKSLAVPKAAGALPENVKKKGQ